MTLNERMADAIRRSTRNVFAIMLGVELGTGDCEVQNDMLETSDGVVAVLGLAGPWVGTGCVTCSADLASRICSRMLLTPCGAVDDEVLDAVAELTNIIIGCVKTDLEQELGPLGLSIPTVVYGRNFRTRSSGSSEWTAVRFEWEGEFLLVKMCLAPRRPTTHPVRLSSSPATLEISSNQGRSTTCRTQP